MVVERRPRPRVRVFGCCLPIPLGMGLLSMGGLTLLVRRTKRKPARRVWTKRGPSRATAGVRAACVAALG